MSLSDPVRARIESVIGTNAVVLFMKGNPEQPQCGFSATVSGILNQFDMSYQTVDVLADQEIREGIKSFSEWPTIPQLYVNGEFVGGCDVVQQLYQSGELGSAIGAEKRVIKAPEVVLSDAAAATINEALSEHQGIAVHLKISANWQHEFNLAPATGSEIVSECNGIVLHFDMDSAARADGLSIDMMETGEGPAFSISNPNAPQGPKQMTVQELKQLLDSGEPLHLFDVREQHERDIALIPGSELLDEPTIQRINEMPKDALLVFQCHSGVRSQSAADYFTQHGYTNVFNLAGGIDAWSLEIDSSVPRY
ncbi:MAG: Grx4 family monothiol glutaredoxin [Pseudomonadota bacterium]